MSRRKRATPVPFRRDRLAFAWAMSHRLGLPDADVARGLGVARAKIPAMAAQFQRGLGAVLHGDAKRAGDPTLATAWLEYTLQLIVRDGQRRMTLGRPLQQLSAAAAAVEAQAALDKLHGLT